MLITKTLNLHNMSNLEISKPTVMTDFKNYFAVWYHSQVVPHKLCRHVTFKMEDIARKCKYVRFSSS